MLYSKLVKKTIFRSIVLAGIALGGVSAGTAISPMHAWAQGGYDPRDTQSLVNRMNQLDNQIQTLSRYLYRGETPPVDAIAGGTNAASPEMLGQYETRLSELEFQLRQMTGTIEQQGYELRKLQGEMEQMRAAAQQQMQQQPVQQRQPEPFTQNTGEPTSLYNQQEVGTVAGQESDIPPQNSLTGDQATALYQQAFSHLRKGDYEKAQTGFEQFLAAYKQHDLSANAQYWLAETHYVRGSFEKAAILFAEGYKNYPKAQKAPDNLLKLGMALGELGKKEDACLSFRQLDKEFPAAALSVRQRAQEQADRLGCGG